MKPTIAKGFDYKALQWVDSEPIAAEATALAPSAAALDGNAGVMAV